jgi:hypothetical protein
MKPFIISSITIHHLIVEYGRELLFCLFDQVFQADAVRFSLIRLLAERHK